MIYLGFQTRTGLCQSAEVRKALGRGVDRESIARVTYATHAVPSALPVHPDSPLYDRWIASQLSYGWCLKYLPKKEGFGKFIK